MVRIIFNYQSAKLKQFCGWLPAARHHRLAMHGERKERRVPKAVKEEERSNNFPVAACRSPSLSFADGDNCHLWTHVTFVHATASLSLSSSLLHGLRWVIYLAEIVIDKSIFAPMPSSNGARERAFTIRNDCNMYPDPASRVIIAHSMSNKLSKYLLTTTNILILT